MKTFKHVVVAGLTVIALIAVSSTISTPVFAKKFTQIGEDMGKCMQKLAGSQGFKDKMCACKDSACAQLVDDLAIAPVVRVRPAVVTNDIHFTHLIDKASPTL
ncbi:MAG: hypothetical protein ABI398_13975 [Devosia sp.]